MTPGLRLSTVLYAAGLAVVSAGMLSVLPAVKVTRRRMQPHLANVGSGGATLRFGLLWTGAMLVQVALAAIGIPVALESVSQAMRKVQARAEFPSREYVAARIDAGPMFESETMPALQERRARTVEALATRIAREPAVVAVTYSDQPVGAGTARVAQAAFSDGAGAAYNGRLSTSVVDPGLFEVFDRPIVAGRPFHGGDVSPTAQTLVVNEAFCAGVRARDRPQFADRCASTVCRVFGRR